ncbi:hypothetical protein Esi_0032_0153 [Ectocarpus siliculosus]|uniref:Uncharacterized protein n=1 Tax=Ectocarpus siliculosus TaxID=2880 RepID=D7FX75_ECTSI|nr:hypothetical protein Esi_0032_0153 [Ectocarpus siliculosus]|eukprot:CBJ26408.1 hypothetical protein Esi_0032_0153 [Ectocarpus siliculosus]
MFTAGSGWVGRRASVLQRQGGLLARGAGAADGPTTGVSRPTQGRGGDGKEEEAMRKLDERDLRQRKFTKGMKQLGYRGGWKAVRACGRGKKWKPAVELLDSMRREGLVPDGGGIF